MSKTFRDKINFYKKNEEEFPKPKRQPEKGRRKQNKKQELEDLLNEDFVLGI